MSDWPKMLNELLNDDSDTMSTWEVEFIESVHKQELAGGDFWEPSEKQLDVIEKTWRKVFG